MCHACRRPLSMADLANPMYEKGVSCHHCIAEHTDHDRDRFRERQHQLALAEARGQRHFAD